MAIKFLQAVNATLKRVRVIQGDDGELATSTVFSTATGLIATGAFEDSGRQLQIDLMIQVWNEAIHEVYNLGIFASGVSTATISLQADTREYAVPGDFERFAGNDRDERVMRGATTGLIIREYPGGYARMLADQPVASDYKGQPEHWARSPESGNIRFDRDPTTGEQDDLYNFLYHKRISRTSTMATDTMPFSDTVADALVPVVAEGWKAVMQDKFSSNVFRASLARSLQTLTASSPRVRYGKR